MKRKKYSKWVSIAYGYRNGKEKFREDSLHDACYVAIKNDCHLLGFGKPGLQAWWNIIVKATPEQMAATVKEWNERGGNVPKRKPRYCFEMPEFDRTITTFEELDSVFRFK